MTAALSVAVFDSGAIGLHSRANALAGVAFVLALLQDAASCS